MNVRHALPLIAVLLSCAAAAPAAKPAERGASALSDPTKLIARGRQLEARGDAAGAMTFYDAALAVDPQNAAALSAAGANALARGDGSLAFGYFSALVAAQPKDADAQIGLA